MAGSDADDRRAALAATFVAGLLVAQMVAGKATRDALLLSTYGASAVPTMMIAGAALSLVTVLCTSWFVTRFGPARVVPVSAAISAALLVCEWGLAVRAPELAAIVLYLHMAVFGATLVSIFWSLVNERFDPRAARRHVGRIGVGSTVGGVVGGVIAWQVSRASDVATTILVMAGMHALCVWGATSIHAPAQREHAAATTLVPPATASPLAAVGLLRSIPYLRQLGALVVLVALGESVLDYLLNRSAEHAFTETADLVTFFAAFHVGAALLAFAVQALVARAALDRLGLGGTVAIMPGVGAVGSIAIAAGGGAVAVIAARGLVQVLANSLYRSAYEVLYTPLSPSQKRPTKTLVDVGLDRVGTMLGGGLTLAVIGLTAAASTPVLGVVAAVLWGVTILVARRLQAGYVEALAQSLRSGALRLEATDVHDATTRRTLAETMSGVDRREVLRQIERMHAASSVDVRLKQTPEAASALASGPIDVLAALAGDDVALRREALRRAKPLAPELVGHVIALLADDAVATDALRALRDVASRSTGQLVDALLDRSQPDLVRRRIPKALRASVTQRAADGLVLGLGDPTFEVRYECALALAKMTRAEPTIRLPREAILETARREVEVGRPDWDARRHGPDALDREVPLFATLRPDRPDRSLEHVFTVLSLVLDPEPLVIAFRALGLDDPALRGTALEYLENVLPAEVRAGLWPYLDDRRVAKRAPRPERQVLQELLRSADSLELPPELRAKRPGSG